MTFLEDAKYCAAIVHAANKFNKYGINVAKEYDFINFLEEDITYNVSKSEVDEVIMTNRVFLFRQIIIKLSRDELCSEANNEFFETLKNVYTTLGEIIIRCHNADSARHNYMKELVTQKIEVDSMVNNRQNNERVLYMLILSEINYIIRKYCKTEFPASCI